jgi:glycosyltransferase involved in cell wall biosynthesis
MRDPFVSVIMTSFNYEHFIPYAIESVLNQTVPDFELIIIDDGSSDSSRQIIEVYQRQDERIRPIFHSVNMGIGRSMNDGIGMAKGTFIASIASDDVWMTHKLKTQLDVLSKDENLVVWSEGLVIDSSGVPTGRNFTEIILDAKGRRKSGNIFDEIIMGNFIFGSSRILKRKNLDGIPWNESLKYLNDYQFAVDLAHKYHFYFIEEPLTCYRVHGSNTLTRDPEGYLVDLQRVYKYFLKRYGNEINRKKRYELWIRYYREMFREYQVRHLGNWLLSHPG